MMNPTNREAANWLKVQRMAFDRRQRDEREAVVQQALSDRAMNQGTPSAKQSTKGK